MILLVFMRLSWPFFYLFDGNFCHLYNFCDDMIMVSQFQDRLRRFVYDDDMVKRIIFIAVVEAFHAAKTAFRSFRLRTRRTLSPAHLGPCSLEEAVNDYIVRNLDLYDVDRSVDVRVYDVIRTSTM